VDLLIPLALAALLIFFLFNSRRKQKARAEQIKSGLVPGATVMTTFGVFGTVLSIDEENNQVTIESGPGTVLRVHRQAIGQIDNPEAATAVDAPAADAPAADASAADAEGAGAETDGEKPAITDAELDAMNARKRAEKDSDVDPESTDVSRVERHDRRGG
jgi:preprotein translocase subunit YajC